MYVLYMDDSILAGPCEKELDDIMAKMKGAELTISVDGDITDFLGVHVECKSNGMVHLTQPLLIDHIMNDLRLTQTNITTRDKPAKSGQ